MLVVEGVADPKRQAKILEGHQGPFIDALLEHAKRFPQESETLLRILAKCPDDYVQTLFDQCIQPTDTPRRSLALSYLLQVTGDDSEMLVDLFLDAAFEQQPEIMPRVDQHISKRRDLMRGLLVDRMNAPLGTALLHHDYNKTYPTFGLQEGEEAFNKRARRRGIATALLYRMGEFDRVWPLLRSHPWPHARAYLIHYLAEVGKTPGPLLRQFRREPNPSTSRGLLMAIGRFDPESVPASTRHTIIETAKHTFQNDADPGIHSIAQWLLWNWGERQFVLDFIAQNSGAVVFNGDLTPSPNPTDKTNDEPFKSAFLANLKRDGRAWYIDCEGHTMAVFDARKVPGINRIFAIATEEVSVAQMLRFRPDHSYYEARSPEAECPVGLIRWFDAASYCRWMSETNGVSPLGYVETNNPADLHDEDLQQIVATTAYRLPTWKEWQYACEAGTTSRRYFGSADELADDYTWHYETSNTAEGHLYYAPSGSKLPNDYGMFSMYDGVREWTHSCTDEKRFFVSPTSGGNDLNFISNNPNNRFGDLSSDHPASLNGFYGFRIARTIPE